MAAKGIIVSSAFLGVEMKCATEWVLAQAGARPWDRDALDRGFIELVRRGSSPAVQR